jgi:cold shock CspA family protein
MRSQGRVKFFDWTKDFGFIWDLDRLVDVFVHVSDLRPARPVPGKKTLYTGEYVEYDVVPSDSREDGLKAKMVTGIRRGDLLCESGTITFTSYSRHQFNDTPPPPAPQPPQPAQPEPAPATSEP